MKAAATVSIAALLGVGALGACSQDGSSGGAAAQGWTKVTVGQLTLQHPSDWTKEEPTGDTWDLRLVGKDVELQVSGEFSEDPTASAALSRLDLPAMAGLPDYDGGGATKIEVEGADTAIRSDFTFKDGESAKQGVWLIAGQYPYPRTSAVSITGSTLDAATVTQIVDSLTYAKKNS